MSQIIAVGLSPTLQKTISFTHLRKDSVNRSTGYRIDASGKAVNTARVLDQLSPGIVTNICPLGEDNAAFFFELAAQDRLAFKWIPVTGRIRYCYTLLEPGTGQVTELVVSEPVAGTDFSEVAERLLDMIRDEASSADALIFAGSRPASYPADLCPRICRIAADAGCTVMADYHGKDLLRTLEQVVPEIIKINEEEFCGTFGHEFPLTEEKLGELIAAKSAELGNTIVITRGSRDTWAATKGELFHHPVHAVTALNTIGCGDSFSAGFLYSWLQDRDTKAALAKGSWCATQNALNYRPGSIKNPDAEGEQLWL